ncbi:phage integrase family protein, partial [Vibrio parahaemolyticus VPTS-2010_2]
QAPTSTRALTSKWMQLKCVLLIWMQILLVPHTTVRCISMSDMRFISTGVNLSSNRQVNTIPLQDSTVPSVDGARDDTLNQFRVQLSAP